MTETKTCSLLPMSTRSVSAVTAYKVLLAPHRIGAHLQLGDCARPLAHPAVSLSHGQFVVGNMSEAHQGLRCSRGDRFAQLNGLGNQRRGRLEPHRILWILEARDRDLGQRQGRGNGEEEAADSDHFEGMMGSRSTLFRGCVIENLACLRAAL